MRSGGLLLQFITICLQLRQQNFTLTFLLITLLADDFNLLQRFIAAQCGFFNISLFIRNQPFGLGFFSIKILAAMTDVIFASLARADLCLQLIHLRMHFIQQHLHFFALLFTGLKVFTLVD